MFSQSRRNLRAPSSAPLGESPAVIGQLYRECENELSVIVSYLHYAVLTESLAAVSDLLSTIAACKINHYKTLCRLLRDLGVPFRLQTRIEGMLPTNETDMAELCTTCLASFAASEEERATLCRRHAEGARDARVGRTLLALAAEKEEHAKALLAMRERMMRS